MQADPTIAEELMWMGFDMVSMANNHTGDYGVGGLRRTTQAVEAAGLMHAGTGENLAEARAPGYLETPDGRVALISAASTFPDGSRAGRPGPTGPESHSVLANLRDHPGADRSSPGFPGGHGSEPGSRGPNQDVQPDFRAWR